MPKSFGLKSLAESPLFVPVLNSNFIGEMYSEIPSKPRRPVNIRSKNIVCS